MTTALPRGSKLQLAALLLWPPLVAVAAAVIVERRAEARLARALADRAPIAVVDHFAFVRAAAGADGVDAGMREVRRISERLGADGYLVLDRRYVDAAPDALLVRP